MSQGGGGGGGGGGGSDKTKEFVDLVKSFKFHLERLEDGTDAERLAQIKKVLDAAKLQGGTHVYVGYPFEAKNAPFKLRTAAVKELALA